MSNTPLSFPQDRPIDKSRTGYNSEPAQKILDRVEEACLIGIWEVNLENDKHLWSDNFYKICGLEARLGGASQVLRESLLHPDEIDAVGKAYAETVATGKPFSIDHKIIKPSGKIRIIRSQGFLDGDNMGNSPKFVGIYQDITDLLTMPEYQGASEVKAGPGLAAAADEIELKKEEEAIFGVEKMYRHLFENNPSAMFIWDWETLAIVDCNVEALMKYGYTREEFLKLTIKDIRPEEDIPLIEAVAQDEEFHGQIHKKTWRHKKKNGALMYMEVTGHLMTYNGRKVSFVQVHDVTMKMQTEQQIRESEERYKLLFYKSPLPKLILDIDNYQIIDVTDKALLHYGYTKLEFVQKNVKDFMLPEDFLAFKEVQLDFIKNRRTSSFGLYHHLKKDGTRIQVEMSGNFLQYNGKTCLKVVCIDVTEREIALMNLRKNEEKLLNAQKIAKLGNWEFEYANNGLSWSEEVYRIWGVTKEEFKLTVQAFFQTIHPEDKAKFKMDAGAAAGGKKELDIQYRILLPDGTIKWVHQKGKPVKSADQEYLAFEGTVMDITVEKQMELSLEESNKRYEYVTKATSDAIWDWNLLADTIYWSEGYKTIFGYDTYKQDFNNKSRVMKIHPADQQRVWQEMNKIIEGNINHWTAQYRFLKADNTFTYVLDKGFVVRDSKGRAIRMVGAMQDISRRIEQEQHLKLLESVITNTKDAVLITDAEPAPGDDHKILYVNEAFIHMTGFSSEEVIGKSPKILQGPKSNRKELDRIHNSLMNWKSCEATLINYKKSGEAFWINFSLSPVADKTGFFTHWIAVERDVTAQKLAEADLKKLNKQLTKQARALATSNLELEQFAYVASHDLQEPLRMVTSFLSLIEKKYDAIIDEKGKQYIFFAVDGARRMRQIISDLLEYSSVGKLENNLEQVDIGQLLTETLLFYQKKIEDSNTTIDVGAMPVLESYRTPLQQIFQNLISNALKYRSVERIPAIKITAEETEKTWKFSVADNGVGIKEAYYDKIFIIFQRLHNRSEYVGTGIGLAICKKIVENLGGKIWVESAENVGSTFYFTIKKAARNVSESTNRR